MKINTIHLSDNIRGMKELPGECIDMTLTSPPYYNQRDYKDDNQLGLEETVDDYISKLCDVFDEVYRVTKKTGVCWVNIGDTYSKKCLLQIPSKFEIEMVKRGWNLRNEIIWSKPNPQPTSAKDRFWNNHEKLFMFVKNTKGYYFDQPVVPQKEISIRRFFSQNRAEYRKDNGINDKEGYSISFERQKQHYEKMVSKSGIEKDFDYEELLRSGKVPTRPKMTVWEITTKSYKGAHFATYPEELCLDPILSSCPEDGVVLDPFMGAGTTAVVAVKNDRNFIGYEINEDYLHLAEQRISETNKNE